MAVVENRRRHGAIRVGIEESVFVDGVYQRNRHSDLTLPPLEEKALGCTHKGQETESQFRLTDVSDGRAESKTYGELPARDHLQLLERGRCGRGKAGVRRALLNEHLSRAIEVEVLHHQSLAGGQQNRQFSKTYRVAPGGLKDLGCSIDGSTVLEVSLVRVEYG